MTNKLNVANWSQFDFLVNNFYEIVEYKRGRGIYGDRVILKRAKKPEDVFGDMGNSFEFYYLDANDVSEYSRTKSEKIKIILKYVISPESMAVICKYCATINPIDWALKTRALMYEANSTDYQVLNDILVRQYALLDGDFRTKLNRHRAQQYFLASSDSMMLVSADYARLQLNLLD